MALDGGDSSRWRYTGDFRDGENKRRIFVKSFSLIWFPDFEIFSEIQFFQVGYQKASTRSKESKNDIHFDR